MTASDWSLKNIVRSVIARRYTKKRNENSKNYNIELSDMTGKEQKNIANFLFEVGILSKTPRSGFFFLGSGQQSVAEHINRVCYIGYVLAMLEDKVDVSKVIIMCLFHDIAETRVSDLNYVHQLYNVRMEEKAIDDIAATLPFGEHTKSIIYEYEKRQSKESKIVKDADNLELILFLKEQLDIGNQRAANWIDKAVKRLITKGAKKLAKTIISTDSDEWWHGDKGDDWWVNRSKNK